MAKLSIEEIVAALKEMTVVELNDLVKAVEAEFGVTAAAPVAMAGAAPAEEEEENKGPKLVSLYIKAIGDKKINLIKAVREMLGLDLIKAKQLVETPNAVVKENIEESEAKEFGKILTDAGAEIEIK